MILSTKELAIVKGLAIAVDAVVETVEDAKKDLAEMQQRVDSCKNKDYMSKELYKYVYWGSDSYWDDLQESVKTD